MRAEFDSERCWSASEEVIAIAATEARARGELSSRTRRGAPSGQIIGLWERRVVRVTRTQYV